MVLRVRQGTGVFWVRSRRGTRLAADTWGMPCLDIPGEGPGAAPVRLPAGMLLSAARRRLFGLELLPSNERAPGPRGRDLVS